MKLFILLALFIFSAPSWSNGCGELIYNKHGTLKKYKYAPLSISESTDKYSSSHWTTNANTEYTTAVFDPGVTTGASKSTQQSVSSNGQCKWFGLFSMAQQRKEYIAQNIDVIRTELARGKGPFSDVLVDSYFCGAEFGQQLRSNLKSQFVKRKLSTIPAEQIASEINMIIESSEVLSKSCENYVVANG
jgi:hypothetical protein